MKHQFSINLIVDTVKNHFLRLYQYVKKIYYAMKLSIRLALVMLGFSLTYPLFIFPKGKFLLKFISANPILSHIFSPKNWIQNQLALALSIYFGVWTWTFYRHWKFKDKTDQTNAYLKHVYFLTQRAGNLLINCFMLFLGMGLYPILMLSGDKSGFLTIVLAFQLFGMPGLFCNYYGKIFIKPSRLLDITAPCMTLVCGLTTLTAIIYVFISNTLNYVYITRLILSIFI